jgi:hypothetical protein
LVAASSSPTARTIAQPISSHSPPEISPMFHSQLRPY